MDDARRRGESAGQPFQSAYDADYAEVASPQLLTRPAGILLGAILTYIGSGAILIAAVLIFVAGAWAPDVDLASTFIATGIGDVIQAGAMTVAAVFAQQGHNGGRIVVTILGVGNIIWNLVQLSESGGIPVGWSAGSGSTVTAVILAYSLVTVSVFWVRGTTPWYRQQRFLRRQARGQ